jgi:hypothetical protein
MSKKLVIIIVVVLAVVIGVTFLVKREPVFVGREYNGDYITVNTFSIPRTHRDSNNELVNGYTVKYYPNGRLWHKVSFKDGIKHGPMVTFWDNGQKQMTLEWDEGVSYSKMRSWDQKGKRLKGTGDEQKQQITELDSRMQTF